MDFLIRVRVITNRISLIGILSILALWFFGLSAIQAADLPATIQKIKPSIVGVGTFHPTRRNRASLKGTGFVVADGLTVVTNYHVVSKVLDTQHKETLAVFVGNGKNAKRRVAKLVASDVQHDLAILSIEGKPLPAMSIESSTNVHEGELYAFTGFPIGAVLGLQPVTHRGIISSITPIAVPANNASELDVKRLRHLKSPYNVYQLDATAYPGNSGSPLYSIETGHVVGVINMVFVKESKENILAKPSGISYAIPAKYVQRLIDTVKNR